MIPGVINVSILKRVFGSKLRGEGAVADVRSPPTVKDLLVARTPPWNRVSPIVINAILGAITEKGQLEAFVRHSMNAGLVARYEALGRETSDSTVVRAQISQILCETGNRAIPSLAKALAAKQTDAATKALMLAGDTFEAAIALAKNQVAAYAGLAATYGLIGKRAESCNYAECGLAELEKLRRDAGAQALPESTVLPSDILDEAERQLRSHLAG